jgi:peptidoglycan/LPS O-acetylase OafA/YrhL
VFFVISGFLIIRLILEGLETNTFSLAGFYARRIRRIFPALILVLAAIWALGWHFMLPEASWLWRGGDFQCRGSWRWGR